MASRVGPELALRAKKEPRGLFGLIDLKTAQSVHNIADEDPAVLAASAVWSATVLESELVANQYDLADSAVNTANQAAAAAVDPMKEEQAQLRVVHDIFDDLVRPVTFDSRWRTPELVSIARRMYSEHVFDPIPSLADALDHARCTQAEILAHVRTGGMHVRGCWVIELILDRR